MSQQSVTTGFTQGDKVWVPLPAGRICGTVAEDRGPLGRNGEHLYIVEVPNDPFAREEFLLRGSEIKPLSEQEQHDLFDRLSSEAIRKFLIHGGLVSILVRDSPEPVWLRLDAKGNVTFTFIEGYSGTGGKASPRFALHGEKIFINKKSEVIDFVKSFGISEAMAKEIVSAVGTAP